MYMHMQTNMLPCILISTSTSASTSTVTFPHPPSHVRAIDHFPANGHGDGYEGFTSSDASSAASIASRASINDMSINGTSTHCAPLPEGPGARR